MEPIDYIPSYVEALVGLLVFGISIPSLLLSVPPRLQAIRDQYGHNSRVFGIPWRRLISVEVAVISVVVSIALIVLYQIPSPAFFCNIDTQPATGFGCGIRQIYITTAPYWVNALVLINIVLTALFIWILRSYDRDRIIVRLGEVCRLQAESQDGQIDDELLQSLGELGELCAAGREKQGLLKVLADLADLEIAPRSWLGIAQIVTKTAASGDERNIAEALDMLQDIFRQSSQSTVGEKGMNPFHNRDILGELENMFILAFGTDSPTVLSQMMTGYDELADQAPNDAAKAFLRIGRLALQKDLFSHAVSALAKLDTLITELLEENGGECPEYAKDALYTYLALLAYFWNHGINTRKHAVTHLEQLTDTYGWDNETIHGLLSEAGEAMQSSLSTADMLEQMLYSKRQLVLVEQTLVGVKELNERHKRRILLRFPSLGDLNDANVAELMACGVTRTQAEAILWQAEKF